MTTTRKTVRHKARPAKAPLRLDRTLKDARRAWRSAEGRVRREVARLVDRSGFEPREVLRHAERWRTRLDREGRKARSQVEARLVELQKRARRDGRSLARSLDRAVSRALASLNIPTRREIRELQQRVERLTAQVERRRR